MRRFLKVLGRLFLGGLVCLGSFALFLFFITFPLTKVTDDFLEHAAHHRYSEAYALTSQGFKDVLSLDEFTKSIQEVHLTEYRDSSRNDRSIDNDTGKLKGTIAYMSGHEEKIVVNLVIENGGRKIDYIGPDSGDDEDGSLTMPSHDKIVSLVQQTIKTYKQAYETDDAALFYNSFSLATRNDYSIDDAEKNFFGQFKDHLSFSGFDDYDFVFFKDPVINDGMLVVEGYFSDPVLYMAGESHIYMKGGFVKENMERKLQAINIKLYDKSSLEE